MALIKMNKHQVYNYIADHPEWFQVKSTPQILYRTCNELWAFISNELDFESPEDHPSFRLYGSTLTAMVHDGILEREFNDNLLYYWYRPILPIEEEDKFI